MAITTILAKTGLTLLPFLPSFVLKRINSTLTKSIASATMDVHILPALSDNYMYVVVDKNTKETAVVDPVEASKVCSFVDSNKLNLTTVLTTHHHWDHAGGNKDMLKAFPSLKIYGGDDRVEAVNNIVKHGDHIEFGHLLVECIHTPCHTSGHICYKVTCKDSGDDDINLFTGDTLFLAGCGRFFEGQPEQMCTAFFDKLGKLPDHTKVYCGHEYTLANLKYAKHVEPDNPEIDKKIEFAQKCRSESKPTVPSTIGEEKLYNPFMRVKEASVQKHAKQTDYIKTMECLRREKNSF